MQELTLPFAGHDDVDFKSLWGKKEFITKFDSMTEFVDGMKNRNVQVSSSSSWIGGSADEALSQCITGNLAAVPESDKLMAKYETMIDYQSSKFVAIDDIAGGVPNVPAFLACSPLNMRRRKRIASDLGPLIICADLTSSGGISASHLVKRGVAILSLVRAMVAKRPVTLWVGGGLSNGPKGYNACYAWTRLDTAPMDLARVAHFITSVALIRGWTYSFLNSHGAGGGWPWDSQRADRKFGQRDLERHMGGEVFYIAPIHLSDESITNPDKWIADNVKKYSMPADIG